MEKSRRTSLYLFVVDVEVEDRRSGKSTFRRTLLPIVKAFFSESTTSDTLDVLENRS